MTTRRTSVISLIIILALYSFINYKGIFKKTAMIIVFFGLASIMIFYLMMVRPVDNISQYLYENGRFSNYIRSIEVFIGSPLGIGYDNVYLASVMNDNVIPHNTLLGWLVMGGLWFLIPQSK